MTSEQPDKYACCKIENNQDVVFLSYSEMFGLNLISVWRFLIMQRNNSEFLMIALSGKAKFKNQKLEKIG